jgi:hypothetical protein
MNLFAEDSFWNTPIEKNCAVDPDSERLMDLLWEKTRSGFKFNLFQWTIPVYIADPDTPVYQIKNKWYADGYGKELKIPIPDNAVSDPQSDGHMVIIDMENNKAFDMLQARRTPDGKWEALTSIEYKADGGGIFDIEDYGGKVVFSVHKYGPCRASGVPAVAGLIFHDEITRGKINHKLAFATPFNDTAKYAYPPATWTDGPFIGGLPEGAVIQLDPNIDLTEYNLNPAALTVAKALQDYGAVNVDHAGACAIYAEGLYGHNDRTWEGLLDESDLSRIDLRCFRVLKMNNLLNK